jgi:hypothetical protein
MPRALDVPWAFCFDCCRCALVVSAGALFLPMAAEILKTGQNATNDCPLAVILSTF